MTALKKISIEEISEKIKEITDLDTLQSFMRVGKGESLHQLVRQIMTMGDEDFYVENGVKKDEQELIQKAVIERLKALPAKPLPPTTPSPRDTLISEIQSLDTELGDIADQIEGISKEYDGEKKVEDERLNDIQAEVKKAKEYAKAIQDELKKKGAVDDDDRKKHEELKSTIDKIKKDLAAAKLDYIPTMYRAAKAALNTAKKEHVKAVDAGKDLSRFNYFGLGSAEDIKKLSDLKQSKKALSEAEKEFRRWDKALEAYNIEKDIIDRLKDSKIPDEIKKCEAARQAIVVMERGLREPPADFMMSNIVMHRGGSLGFEAQVIEKSQLPDYLKPLSDDKKSGPPRAVVQLPSSTDESMYFMGTRLKSTEVVVYHKTVEQDDGFDTKVTLVQDQHSIRDHTPQKDWSKLSAEENAKTALQIAIMYASNHKKGSSAIVLRGQDGEQIKRIHAALLWVKYQVANGLYDAVNDLGYGQLPQNSDLSDLVIHFRSEGPAKAGTFLGRSQKALDLDFIKQVMPDLDTKSNEFAVQKQQLQAWKNESRAVKKEDKSQSIQDPGQIHVIGSKPKGP